MDLRSQELFHFCPRCGTQNNKREVFCSFCRLPLSHFITYPVWQIEKTLQQQNISVPFKPSPIMLGHNIDTDKDIFITDTERTSGMYVIGGTGVGKSTLLTGVFLGDILNGHGGLFIDVDGDSINALLPRIPEERMQDVILLDPGSDDRYVGINPLAGVQSSRDSDRVIQIFKRLWNIGPETPNLENTLRACLLTLWYNKKTIAEMPLLLRDEVFRQACIASLPSSISSEWVRWYWEQDFGKWYKHIQLERSDSTLNKILQLLMIENTAYVVSQSNTTIDFRKFMDEGKIILLRLSLKDLGEDAVRFLGTILMAELKNALLSRADKEISEREFFSVCADEWQLYLTSDFKDMLTRGRKYGLGATIANQSLSQLRDVDRELEGITQQINIHVTFRIGADDADTLAPYYAREPKPEYKEQEKKLPVSNPFDWLVSGHTHTNPMINWFVDGTLRKIHTALSSEYAKNVRADFNSFLYRAMTNSDPLSMLCDKAFVSLLLQVDYYYPIAPFYFGQTVAAEYNEERMSSVERGPANPRNLVLGQHDYTFYPSLNASRKTDEPDEKMAAVIIALIRASDDVSLSRAASHFETLAQAKLTQRVEAYLTRYQEFSKSAYFYLSLYTLPNNPLPYYGNPFKDGHFFTPKEEAQRSRKLPEKIVAEDRQALEAFIAFLKKFRDFILTLAKEPMLSSSGIYEMVEVGRRTVADMENEMAQELLNLPNRVSYVAIGSRGARYKPLMKTKPLPYTKQAESLLQIHKTQALENAKQYTTEASLIEQEIQARRRRSGVTPTPVASVTAKGERKQPALPTTPHAIMSIPEETTPDTYLELLYYFSNLTLKQAVIKLAGLNGQNNDEQAKINKREQSKMNRLIADGYVDTVPSEETSFLIAGGRAPLVYRLKKKGYDKLQKEKGLKPINQGGFSPHAYKVNEVLCAIVQGVKETSNTLVDFTHEKQFRQQPIAVGNQGLEPDSWLCFQVDGQLQSFFLEVDLRSEGSGKLKEKIRRYQQAIKIQAHQGFTVHTVRIVFINPNGKKDDTDRLVRIIEETIEPADAAYFLVASVTIDEIAPHDLLSAAIYSKPLDKTLSSLFSRHVT